MTTIKDYVTNRFPRDLEEFRRKRLGMSVSELSDYEKTLIYKYTKDYFEDLNEILRAGKSHDFEVFLNQALSKLPNYQDLVYRGTRLSQFKKARFEEMADKKETFIELAFTSSSKSELVANQFSRGDTVFYIFGKQGKEVEQFSFHGTASPMNEKEVIFRSKTTFKVLDFSKVEHKTIIVLEELTNE